MGVHLPGEPDRLLDRLAGLSRQSEYERAVDHDAELPAVSGEAAGPIDSQALLDVVEYLLIPGLVADQQEPQPVVPEHLQRLARDIRLSVTGPGDAETGQAL